MHRLCATDDVDSGESLRLELDGFPPLAIFNLDGEFFVMDDTCTHGEASLCDGDIEDGEVECPWHNARFCIKSGRALTFPATEPQKIYRVRVKDGVVWLDA